MRAVLADDERLMREQLRARLAEVWPELDIVAEARHGAEAVELVQQHRPDVVFLDIRMPGMTGVDAAREIAQMDVGEDGWLPEIVFITAYDQYAVEAFEHAAFRRHFKSPEKTGLQICRASDCLCLDAGGRNGQRSRARLLPPQRSRMRFIS